METGFYKRDSKTESKTISEAYDKSEISRLFKPKKMRLKRQHWAGIIVAAAIIFVSFLLWMFTGIIDEKLFYFMSGISLVIAGIPFFANLIFEAREEKNKEEMFLEFTRDLVESVRSGTSISKSIMNVRTKDYSSLNPYINKLANQISMGIPVKEALDNFSNSVQSRVISRAITLIQEAERAGGKIETILESVASSVGQIEKLRKERKAAIYNLTVQGYIVFMIFIAIMLVMQFKILPITTELGGIQELDSGGSGAGFGTNLFGGVMGTGGGTALSQEDMARAFMYLLITQGFFAGLVIGKVSEGNIRAGLKHSFVLVSLALLISTGANVFL